jgi:hypothetical protein
VVTLMANEMITVDILHIVQKGKHMNTLEILFHIYIYIYISKHGLQLNGTHSESF